MADYGMMSLFYQGSQRREVFAGDVMRPYLNEGQAQFAITGDLHLASRCVLLVVSDAPNFDVCLLSKKIGATERKSRVAFVRDVVLCHPVINEHFPCGLHQVTIGGRAVATEAWIAQLNAGLKERFLNRCSTDAIGLSQSASAVALFIFFLQSGNQKIIVVDFEPRQLKSDTSGFQFSCYGHSAYVIFTSNRESTLSFLIVLQNRIDRDVSEAMVLSTVRLIGMCLKHGLRQSEIGTVLTSLNIGKVELIGNGRYATDETRGYLMHRKAFFDIQTDNLFPRRERTTLSAGGDARARVRTIRRPLSHCSPSFPAEDRTTNRAYTRYPTFASQISHRYPHTQRATSIIAYTQLAKRMAA